MTSGRWNQSHRHAIAAQLVLPLFILLFCLFIPAWGLADDSPKDNDIQLSTTPLELLGPEIANRYQKLLAPEKPISWEVYIPNSELEEKPGVLVYISPMDSGRIDSRWRNVMDDHNLIYISANDSGNKIPTARRMVLATFAVRALGQSHAFDVGKIFVSGFSGGGRVASKVASQYPEVFSGALYICGVDAWKKSQTPKIDRVIQNRFVFLTGSKDFNRMETRKVHQRYLKEGALNSKLMVIPGMGHVHPDANVLAEALDFLSQRTNPATQLSPESG